MYYHCYWGSCYWGSCCSGSCSEGIDCIHSYSHSCYSLLPPGDFQDQRTWPPALLPLEPASFSSSGHSCSHCCLQTVQTASCWCPPPLPVSSCKQMQSYYIIYYNSISFIFVYKLSFNSHLLPQGLLLPPLRAPPKTAPPRSPAPTPRMPPSISSLPVLMNLVSVEGWLPELLEGELLEDEDDDPPNFNWGWPTPNARKRIGKLLMLLSSLLASHNWMLARRRSTFNTEPTTCSWYYHALGNLKHRRSAENQFRGRKFN